MNGVISLFGLVLHILHLLFWPIHSKFVFTMYLSELWRNKEKGFLIGSHLGSKLSWIVKQSYKERKCQHSDILFPGSPDATMPWPALVPMSYREFGIFPRLLG